MPSRSVTTTSMFTTRTSITSENTAGRSWALLLRQAGRRERQKAGEDDQVSRKFLHWLASSDPLNSRDREDYCRGRIRWVRGSSDPLPPEAALNRRPKAVLFLRYAPPMPPPPHTAPWPSPISARSVAEGARRIDDLAAGGDFVCWLERLARRGRSQRPRLPQSRRQHPHPHPRRLRRPQPRPRVRRRRPSSSLPLRLPSRSPSSSSTSPTSASTSPPPPRRSPDPARRLPLRRPRLRLPPPPAPRRPGTPTSSGGDETAALVAIPLPADPPAARRTRGRRAATTHRARLRRRLLQFRRASPRTAVASPG